MALVFGTSATGIRTASASGRSLHSARDPLGQSRRFLDERLKANPAGFIILGSCLGYLEAAIDERFPALPRYSVQFDPAFRGEEVGQLRQAWYPDSLEGLDAFLLQRLDPADLNGLAIIDWPPAAEAFPEASAACLRAVKKAVLIMNGSANALQAFGPACVLNAARTAAYGRSFFSLVPGSVSKPIVIAASGPSLEKSLAELAQYRDSVFLMILSSAARAILRAGLRPDLIVSSDPGYWAGLHLSGLPWTDAPLAFPLSARIPRRLLETRPLLAIDHGSGFESALSSELGLPAFPLPASGTVAAIALDIALRLGSGPIVFCALDLAALDIRSHCRPHAFDHYVSGSATRFRPAYSNAFIREAASEKRGAFRVSPQLETYGAYFSRVAARENRISALPSAAPGARIFRQSTLGEIVRERKPSKAAVPFAPSPGPSPASWTAESARDAAMRIIRRSRKALDSQAAPSSEQRAILEQLSFSSLLKLRKSERSGDAALRQAGLKELDDRIEALLSRIERIAGPSREARE
jgi:hypothetical protein